MITLAVKIDWPILLITVLGALAVYALIISAVNGSAQAAKEKPNAGEPEPQNVQRPDSSGDLMRGLGLMLLLLSLAFGAFTLLTFETSVETAYGKTVHNFALDSARNLRLAIAGLGILCGVILSALAPQRK